MAEREAPHAVYERESLIRMAPAVDLRESEDTGSVLVGYASVFNEWATIDSWEGKFRERVAPGAFRKTLRERGDQIQVLFNHGMDPQIGDKPLGRIRSIREDEHGLHVEVPLDDTSYNQDIKALLKSGALRGMSFRMSIPKGGDDWVGLDRTGDDLPERTIREIKLLELGPVTFPAYAATQAGVRAHAPKAFAAFRSATEGQQIAPDEETPEDLETSSPETPETTTIPQEPAEATPDSGPEDSTRADTDDASAVTESPRPRDPKIRELELMRMRTVAANRAARLVRST